MSKGNIVGLVLSLVCLLGLVISMKWAIIYYKDESVTIDVEIPNRVA
jgi:hypothetical protein